MQALNRAAALASLLALAADGRAAERARSEPGFRLGPARLLPSLELKNAGLDTNVFNTLTDPARDMVFVLTPRLDARAHVFGKRVELTGSGWLDFNRFRASSSESSTDTFGEAGATFVQGRASLALKAGKAHLRQRMSIEFDQRLRREERWQSLALELRLSSRLHVRGEAAEHAFRFEEGVLVGSTQISTTLDRIEERASLAGLYALSDQTRFVLRADSTAYNFAEIVGQARPFDRSHRVLGGFEAGERALVSGRLMVGVRSFPIAVSAGSDHYTGPALILDATKPIGGWARVNVLAERDLDLAVELATIQGGNLRTAYVHERLRLGGQVGLPLDLIGEAFAGLESIRFLLPTQQGAVQARRADRLYVGGGRLLRRFGRQIRIGVGLSWARRISNVREFSYEGMRYGIQGEFRPN